MFAPRTTQEMGGEEVGVLLAIINCVNRADGVLGPWVSLAIKNITGSWIPVFYLGAVGMVLKAALYWRSASTKPARVLYAEQTGTRSW